MTGVADRFRTLARWGLAFAAIGVVQATLITILYRAGPIWGLRAAGLMALSMLFWAVVSVVTLELWQRRPTMRSALPGLIGIFLVISVVEPLWVEWINPFRLRLNPYPLRIFARSDTNLVFYLAIASITWMVVSRRRQMASELAAARLDAALVDLQLHVLTLQLHPHFLFNTLNLISQLAYESAARALRTLEHLRQLLVESISHAAQREVALADELRFLDAYLDIQQTRFGERLRVSIDAAPATERAAVPHLLLQPLVENAILHGLAPRAGPGHLEIAMRRATSRVLISIADDGVGLARPARDGTGLTNTRLRLEQLYAGDYRLTLEPRAGGGTLVALNIPYREASSTRLADAADVEPEEPPLAEPSPWLERLRRVPLTIRIVALWTVIALIWTQLGSMIAAGNGRDFNWWRDLADSGINAAIWMGLTPIAVSVARRLEARDAPVRRVALVAGGAAVVLAHVGLWLLAVRLLWPERTLHIIDSVAAWMAWDATTYTAIVALVGVAALSTRFRDVRIAIAETRGRIGRARVASLRLRLQPAILLTGLDAVARTIAQDPGRSEAAITRMGDLLRMLLQSSSSELVTVSEEMALLQAYSDVVSAPAAVRSGDRPRRWLFEAITASVPAVSITGLAAAIGGSLERALLTERDGLVRVELTASNATVDTPRVDELRLRMDALFPGRAEVVVTEDASGLAQATFVVPGSSRNAGVDDEESVVLELAAG